MELTADLTGHDPMSAMQLTPYAPGQARGTLRRPRSGPGILVLEHGELDGLSGPFTGLVMVSAAPFSHAMIRLLDLGVPVVMADRAQADRLPLGEQVWLDGERGLLVHPAGDMALASPPAWTAVPARTGDGERIELRCTVGDASAAGRARAAGATAIGLVRTEYLLPADDAVPDEAYYQQAFADICQAANPLPVTLRLLDIAADKRPSWLSGAALPGGALGMQGARLFNEIEVQRIVQAQVRAAGRVARQHQLRLLIPYLTSVEEFLRWREVVLADLPDRLPIGAMVETPALAMMLDRLMDEADFVALGLNDLMQCLFAADRDQPALGPWLDPHAPALYRFLDGVAEAAGAQVGEIQLCGLLPQLPGILPVLLGLGFRTFSVTAHVLPYLHRRAARVPMAEARALAQQVCCATDSDAVRAMLTSFMEQSRLDPLIAED
ncbi:putative PEP-binding protein [Thioalkalivibrio sulfidiphilus]|nr:putative PEP-binding protein [Thioalkalivibrio sulfidiphilus]